MERAEVLFAVLTHVATTDCGSMEIDSIQLARLFLLGWGRPALTSSRHATTMPVFQRRAQALQEEEEREAAFARFWETTEPEEALRYMDPPSSPDQAAFNLWWLSVYGGGPPPPPRSPGSDASDRTIGSYS